MYDTTTSDVSGKMYTISMWMRHDFDLCKRPFFTFLLLLAAGTNIYVGVGMCLSSSRRRRDRAVVPLRIWHPDFSSSTWCSRAKTIARGQAEPSPSALLFVLLTPLESGSDG